jgi:hypothetical protein
MHQHIFSFLNPIQERELQRKRQEMFDFKEIIELCQEMGFLHELREKETGEYAHPKNLYFFRLRSRFFHTHFYVARSDTDNFCTSMPCKNICRVCYTYRCKNHQIKNEKAEKYIADWLRNNRYEFIPIKDKYTKRQFMIYKDL